MDDLVSAILATTYTKSQLLRRVRLLKDFISYRLFNEGGSGKDFATSVEEFIKSQNITDNWLASLGEQYLGSFTPENFNDQFKKLESALSATKSIIVYLPVELSERDIEEIGRWFKQNLGPQALFEVSFDADLIGGCALSYKGIYKDYSIRANIKANQKAILDSLKEFKQ